MGEKSAHTTKRRGLTALVDRFRRDDDGSTAIEYSLIAALIFLAIVSAIRSYTASTSAMYNDISETIENG